MLFHRVVDNDDVSVKALIRECRGIKGLTIRNTVFGMENTGVYCRPLISAVLKIGGNLVVENAVQIMRSMGVVRGKSDILDAHRIAGYLYRSREELRLYLGRRKVMEQLGSLCRLRNRLKELLLALRMPMLEEVGFVSGQIGQQRERLCGASASALRNDLVEVERVIRETWKGDERLARLMELILSVPSVGEVTALQLLLTTNEFLSIDCPKKFACYAGVAPFPYRSGTALNGRDRVSPMANRRMKGLLHTCAVVAKRWVPEIRDYYLRKTGLEGKHKMLVLNAIRYKLIARVFACVKADRKYEVR